MLTPSSPLCFLLRAAQRSADAAVAAGHGGRVLLNRALWWVSSLMSQGPDRWQNLRNHVIMWKLTTSWAADPETRQRFQHRDSFHTLSVDQRILATALCRCIERC
eukprot:365940-Rhodomonas_salina.1